MSNYLLETAYQQKNWTYYWQFQSNDIVILLICLLVKIFF